MAKKKAKRNRSNKKPVPPDLVKRKKEPEKIKPNMFGRKISSLKLIWSVIVGIGVIIGLWAFFCPRISVLPLNPLTPSEPLSAPFTVSNDGYLSINNVKFSCAIKKIVTKQGVTYMPEKENNFSPKFIDPSELASKIGPGEKYTAECPITKILKFHTPIESADIAVVISYEMSLLPISREEFFRFQSRKNSEGYFMWVPQPVEK